MTPGWQIFIDNDRVSATFKDPNVYGPFLILPLPLLMTSVLTKHVRFGTLVAIAFLLGGLFRSFSRGAWIFFRHIGGRCGRAHLRRDPDPRMRARIVMIGLIVAAGALLLVIALSSIGPIRDMLLVRARAIQPYDVGPGGRFSLQELALTAILNTPGAWDRSASVWSTAANNITFICSAFWSTAGSAAPSI